MASRHRHACVGLWMLLACRPATVPQSHEATPGLAPPPIERGPTWRIDRSWIVLRDVAMDRQGRVAVVGHRLLTPQTPSERPHAAGVIAVYGVDGELVWEDEIDGPWVEGYAIAAMSDDGVVAVFRERKSADTDASILVRRGPGGEAVWEQRVDLNSADDPARPQHPLDIAVGPGGTIAWVAMHGAGGTFSDTSNRLTILDASGSERWHVRVEDEYVDAPFVATSVAVNDVGHIFTAGYWVGERGEDYSSWVVQYSAQGERLRDTTIEGMPVIEDLVLMGDGDVIVVGEGEYDGEYVPAIRMDPALEQPRGDDGPWSVVDGLDALTDEDIPIGLALGSNGSMALIGHRDVDPWGRLDSWIVRLDGAKDAWPSHARPGTSVVGDPSGVWTGDPRRDHPTADALVRWKLSTGPILDSGLTTDDSADRAVAIGILRGGSLACPSTLYEYGPDADELIAGDPGPYSTYDDPCFRRDMAIEWLYALTGEDLDLVMDELAELVDGDLSERVNDWDPPTLTRTVFERGIEQGRGFEVAQVLLGSATGPEREGALEYIEGLRTPQSRDVLRQVVADDTCAFAMSAALALEAQGEPVELSSRPARADAQTLLRRYCVLAHHPNGAVAGDYWASLLGSKKRYRVENRCVGSWSDDDPMFEPCEESRRTTASAPYIDDGDFRCVGLVCTMNESSSEEAFPNGTFDRLQFLRGRDGELYVDRIVRVHWMGDKPK